jgi:hypothetical protein
MSHNESGITALLPSITQLSTWAEWEFTIKNNGAATGTTYYFRPFDNNINEAVVLTPGHSYPSISDFGWQLVASYFWFSFWHDNGGCGYEYFHN